jgi:hypothetical protein
MRAKLAIGADGRVVLPKREAAALGLLEGDPVDVHAVRGAYVVVERPRKEAEAGYLAGSLRALSAPEVFHFLATSLKTGTLLLSFASDHERGGPLPDTPEGLRRKTVSFRDGQITFATSTERADRLGAVLWRSGRVPREELERCARLVSAGRPLGQVLVEEGLLDPGQLYAAMIDQIREIVLNAFLDEEGEFVFVEGRPDDRNAVKLPVRTRELLLEGMHRREELEPLAALIPDRDAVVRRTGKAPGPLSEAERHLLEAVNGERIVRQLLDDSQVGPYLGTRTLAALLRAGLVDPIPPRSPARGEEVLEVAEPAPPTGGPFETYARIFRHIHGELSRVQPDAGRRLESYFERLGPDRAALFASVRIGADGDLDVAQVLLNVSDGSARPGAAVRARALEALESFLAFALFEVKNCLSPTEAARVLAEVGRMQAGKA